MSDNALLSEVEVLTMGVRQNFFRIPNLTSLLA